MTGWLDASLITPDARNAHIGTLNYKRALAWPNSSFVILFPNPLF